MTDPQLTSDFLSSLRDRKYDAHGRRSVDREQLDALVECAEAAKRFKTARIGEMSLALQALDAAVSKLEAL
jgi:hypothetical protein